MKQALFYESLCNNFTICVFMITSPPTPLVEERDGFFSPPPHKASLHRCYNQGGALAVTTHLTDIQWKKVFPPPLIRDNESLTLARSHVYQAHVSGTECWLLNPSTAIGVRCPWLRSRIHLGLLVAVRVEECSVNIKVQQRSSSIWLTHLMLRVEPKSLFEMSR